MSDDSKDDLSGDATLDLCVEVSPKTSGEPSPETYSNHDSKETTPEIITPGGNKDAREALDEMHLTDSFFVSDTLDDESLIIPPTPCDEAPGIVGNSPDNDSSSIIEETQILGDDNQASPQKELLFDEDEEDEWSKPTQPLFPMKQDEEQQIIGPSDGEDENDETFVETESILGSCYDLPTQPISLPKESETSTHEGGEDDWNLQLIESQATQSFESLQTVDHRSKTEAAIVEEIIKAPENGFQDNSKDDIEVISINDEKSVDNVEILPDKKVDDDERDKTPSPAKFTEKEGTPEEVRLFAEIESLVNAARAENKSGFGNSMISEQNDVVHPADKNSFSDDSDQDEIAPSQTSRSVEASRENVNLISSPMRGSPITSPRKNDPSVKTTADTSTFAKDLNVKENTPVKSKPSLVKKTNRLTKKPLKKLQESEKNDEADELTTETAQPSLVDDGAEKKSTTLSSYLPSLPSVGKEILDSSKIKESETLNLEEIEHVEGTSEAAEKTPSQLSGPEIHGPPLFSSFRTPLQKKSIAKLGLSSKSEKKIPFVDISVPPKRVIGRFSDEKSLQKLLVSVGIDLEEEKLKLMCSPNKQCVDEEVLKRKVVQRVFIKDNEVLEEFFTLDDVHAKIEISPMSSSSTSVLTKTSSFVSSGEMGDISSSISSKSLSGSSGVMPDIRSSQEETGRSLKSPQRKDAISFATTVSSLKPVSELTTFSDKISSQEDFKNPMVVISPIKHGKRFTAKKGSTSDSPKAKRTRKLTVKNEESTTESSDIDSLKKKDTVSGSRAAASKAPKKGRNKKRPRTETKRRAAQKNIPEPSEPSTNGVENQDPCADVPDLDIDEDSMNDPSPFGEILPGIRVMARWKDGYYYPGIVKRQEVDGRWEVMFDDGALRIVIQDSLLKIPYLQVGTHVLAMSPDGYYDPGIVCSHYREGKNTGYVVEQLNGETRRYQRGSVILSTDQAKLIINKRPVAPPSLTINLDNIVGGKRKRLSSTHQRESSSSPPPLKSTRPSRRKNPDPNLDSTDQQSSAVESPMSVSEESKEELTNECVVDVPVTSKKKAAAKTSKSKSKKGAKKKPNPTSTTTTSVEPNSSESPADESAAAKAAARRDGAPLRSSRLFEDFAFLLTYSNKVAEDEDDEERMTFDKQHLCQLILGGGGIIYDTFEEAQKCSKRKVILLASTYVRTIKYLQCVAANIPCIQHYWIQNCVLTRTIVEWSTYILQTGYSIIHNTPISWHGKTNIFDGKKIVITADKKSGKEFVNLWTPVLLAAKADLVQKWILPSLLIFGTSSVVDLIVTNNTCPANILQAAKKRKIPVVSTEYIIQCIIAGTQLSPDEHEKFKHDFKA